LAPCAVIACSMPAILWLARLSSRTMSPEPNVGASTGSTSALKRAPLMARRTGKAR
jgi:hypothetical protein